jgi:LysM repeat protein
MDAGSGGHKAAAAGDTRVSEKEPKGTAQRTSLSEKPQTAPLPGRRPAERSGRTKIVRKGDSVGSLLMEDHGRVSEDLIQAFKVLNPQIKDIHRLKEGEEIVLPKL